MYASIIPFHTFGWSSSSGLAVFCPDPNDKHESRHHPDHRNCGRHRHANGAHQRTQPASGDSRCHRRNLSCHDRDLRRHRRGARNNSSSPTSPPRPLRPLVFKPAVPATPANSRAQIRGAVFIPITYRRRTARAPAPMPFVPVSAGCNLMTSLEVIDDATGATHLVLTDLRSMPTYIGVLMPGMR